ncbi:MAG TPA: hypothetical protein VEC43_03300, partial [Candidatus Acidoferrales bacterium]|nr:hypothetical protein [Candidatus Acidoferrales bacterium]
MKNKNFSIDFLYPTNAWQMSNCNVASGYSSVVPHLAQNLSAFRFSAPHCWQYLTIFDGNSVLARLGRLPEPLTNTNSIAAATAAT